MDDGVMSMNVLNGIGLKEICEPVKDIPQIQVFIVVDFRVKLGLCTPSLLKCDCR
jgi:hypothetical protein